MPELLKKQWNLLAGLATWMGSVIGGFWRAPVAGTRSGNSQLQEFGQFFLTLGVGLLAIPAFRYRQRRHTRLWLVAAVLLMVLTPVAYFLHERYATTWTCPYAGSRIVIGSDAGLTEHGRQYKNDHPHLTDEEIVFHHAGNVEEIWSKESLGNRTLALGVMYVVFLPLFAASVICVIEAFYCGTRSR